MSEYKRLTAKKEDRYWEQEEFWQSAEEPSYEKIEEIYTRLAELEDKIEIGLLIDIPCKVGDTAYVIEYYEIKEYLVTTICIDDNNEVFLELERNHNLIYQYPYNVWFNKSEAEVRLKEL